MINKIKWFSLLLMSTNISVFAQNDFSKIGQELDCGNCTVAEQNILSYNLAKQKDSTISKLEKKINSNLNKIKNEQLKALYKKIIESTVNNLKSIRKEDVNNQRLLDGHESNIEYSCNLLYIYWSNRIIDIFQFYQDVIIEASHR